MLHLLSPLFYVPETALQDGTTIRHSWGKMAAILKLTNKMPDLVLSTKLL
jgi:hypothetical protein